MIKNIERWWLLLLREHTVRITGLKLLWRCSHGPNFHVLHLYRFRKFTELASFTLFETRWILQRYANICRCIPNPSLNDPNLLFRKFHRLILSILLVFNDRLKVYKVRVNIFISSINKLRRSNSSWSLNYFRLLMFFIHRISKTVSDWILYSKSISTRFFKF